jgi:hypothetical protein
MKYIVATIVTAASMAACDLNTRTRLEQPSLLRLSPFDSVNFVAPDTVAVNQTFTISVETIGGTCDRIGRTRVSPKSALAVDFQPFDITETNDDSRCSLDGQTFTHTGQLSGSAVGTLTITLFGRDWNSDMISRVKTVVIK